MLQKNTCTKIHNGSGYNLIFWPLLSSTINPQTIFWLKMFMYSWYWYRKLTKLIWLMFLIGALKLKYLHYLSKCYWAINCWGIITILITFWEKGIIFLQKHLDNPKKMNSNYEGITHKDAWKINRLKLSYCKMYYE